MAGFGAGARSFDCQLRKARSGSSPQVVEFTLLPLLLPDDDPTRFREGLAPDAWRLPSRSHQVPNFLVDSPHPAFTGLQLSIQQTHLQQLRLPYCLVEALFGCSSAAHSAVDKAGRIHNAACSTPSGHAEAFTGTSHRPLTKVCYGKLPSYVYLLTW